MAITPLPLPTPAGVVGSACAEVDALAGSLCAAAELVAGVEELQRLRAKAAAAGALIGAVMKEMSGQADARRVRELILEELT